jgi:hypothetical protein
VPARNSFDYAILRIVPHVERGEFINAGVILFCRERAFLGARTELSARRLLALAPDLEPDTLVEIAEHLESIPRICAGDEYAGPIARLAQPERFHWLVAPRSTVVQVSRVHSGLCDDPAAELGHLFVTMVHEPRREERPAEQGFVRLSRADYEQAIAALQRTLMAKRDGEPTLEVIATALRLLIVAHDEGDLDSGEHGAG